jgi:hypothetical protein
MDEQQDTKSAELITGPLYKYRSLSGPPEGNEEDPSRPSPRECTRRLIMEGEIYHAKRTELNDPFDSRFIFKDDYSYAEKLWRAFKVANVGYPDDDPRQSMKRAVSLLLQNPDCFERHLLEVEADLNNRVDQEIGVFCLSERNDSTLMWSHYADSHKGVCIQLGPVSTMTEELKQWVLNCHRVIYKEDNSLPAIDGLFIDKEPEPGHNAKLMFLHKNYDWHYEQEFRHITTRCPGTSRLPQGLIKGIIFGALTSDADKAQVREWVEEAGLDIAFQQAKLKERHYGLDIVDC